MKASAKRRSREELRVTIGPFRGLADYAACTEIQREVWRFADIDIVPVATLMAMAHSGGIVLGAYDARGAMIGFVSSFVGMENGDPTQHSHMLAVRSAFRNFDVGFRLKLAQRKEALRRKIRVITWTFDPMQPSNAFFNLGKLGARASVYELNFYGESTSSLHRGLPTDRFLARWDLASRAVERRLEEGPPRRDLRRELRAARPINALVSRAPGAEACGLVALDAAGSPLLFEVPANLGEIRGRDVVLALEWQSKMRQLFRSYFKKGYAATDFWIADDGGHPRTFYVLEKDEAGSRAGRNEKVRARRS